jgi:acetyl-CoA carboxylase beta subunit
MKLGSDQHIPQSPCLNCGKLLDGATCIDNDSMPDPGDVTICIYCGHLMMFDAQMRLRDLSDEKVRQVAGDGRIVAVQRARRVLERRAIESKAPSITCPTCGHVSYNGNDVRNRYCGYCHSFHEDRP